MSETGNAWPTTVEEAVERVLSMLSDQEKDALRTIRKGDLIGTCHFGLGLAIRDQFGLWARNKALLRACAQENARETSGVGDLPCSEGLTEVYALLLGADGASWVIMRALWRRLQEAGAG